MSREKFIPPPNRPPYWQFENFFWGALGGLILPLFLLSVAGFTFAYWGLHWRYFDAIKTSYFGLIMPWQYDRFAPLPIKMLVLWGLYSSSLYLSMVACSMWLSWTLSKPGKDGLHARGRRLSDDPSLANKELEPGRQRTGAGLYIHPKVQLSLEAETQHFVFAGSTGSGKTTAMQPLIDKAIKRKDYVILFDPKPDFTQKYQGVILAPWDARGVQWDLGADCLDAGDADTLASRLIADSKGDLTWTDGARQIVAAAIVQLQHDYGTSWDWQSLVHLLADDGRLQTALEVQNPMAARLLRDLTSKTAQSFLITLSANTKTLIRLAQAWTGKRKWSVRRYLLEPTSWEARQRTVILSNNDRYKPLAQAYIQSIISSLSGLICSPEVPDSRKRRLWQFFDEAPQLGKVAEIEQLLAVGRSKGVRVVVGVQDVSQLRELYSRDTASAWASLFGTWIVTQIKGEESPKWFSGLLGEREVWRYTAAVQRDQTNAVSIGDNWQREKGPVVHADELTDTLGPHKWGIDAILWRPGLPHVYRLTWPYVDHPKIRKLYIPHKPLTVRQLLESKPNSEKQSADLEAQPQSASAINHQQTKQHQESAYLENAEAESKDENPIEATEEVVENDQQEVINGVWPVIDPLLTSLNMGLEALEMIGKEAGNVNSKGAVVAPKKQSPKGQKAEKMEEIEWM